jgi:predicted nucleic acid-binding Zn ribbon protein
VSKAPRGPRRSLGAERAGDAIAQVLRMRGTADDVRAERLVTEWTDLVGPKIAQRTRPDGVGERILWIEVATSAWLQELNLLRPQLLANLVERLGEPRLFDDLKFRLAGRRNRHPIVLPRARRPPLPEKPLPPPATGAAREAIVREVASVDDVELRELIARVRITHDK